MTCSKIKVLPPPASDTKQLRYTMKNLMWLGQRSTSILNGGTLAFNSLAIELWAKKMGLKVLLQPFIGFPMMLEFLFFLPEFGGMLIFHIKMGRGHKQNVEHFMKENIGDYIFRDLGSIKNPANGD